MSSRAAAIYHGRLTREKRRWAAGARHQRGAAEDARYSRRRGGGRSGTWARRELALARAWTDALPRRWAAKASMFAAMMQMQPRPTGGRARHSRAATMDRIPRSRRERSKPRGVTRRPHTHSSAAAEAHLEGAHRSHAGIVLWAKPRESVALRGERTDPVRDPRRAPCSFGGARTRRSRVACRSSGEEES